MSGPAGSDPAAQGHQLRQERVNGGGKLEQRTDMYKLSLRSHIESVSGQLHIVASIPTGDVGTTNFSSVRNGEKFSC